MEASFFPYSAPRGQEVDAMSRLLFSRFTQRPAFEGGRVLIGIAGLIGCFFCANLAHAQAVTDEGGGISVLGGADNSSGGASPAVESSDENQPAATPDPTPTAPEASTDDPAAEPADPNPAPDPQIAIGGIQYGSGAVSGSTAGPAKTAEVVLPRTTADPALSSGRHVTGVIKNSTGRVVGILWRQVLGWTAQATDDAGDNDVLVLKVGAERREDFAPITISDDPDVRSARVRAAVDGRCSSDQGRLGSSRGELQCREPKLP